ncbi:unnamed protein product, partial [Ectocarpus sp. 6 AP-2014]
RFVGRDHGDSVLAAHQRGECRTSPARLKHQAFVLLYSLIEGCHEPSVFFTLLHTLDFEAILGVVQDAREAFAVASRDFRMKERTYLKLRRARWRSGVLLVFKGWKRKLKAATEEHKRSEEQWESARRGCSTPVLFLRALFDGGRADSPEKCAEEEARFESFLDEWQGAVRSIEIKREGRLEKMYFVVPEWCRAHWKKNPVIEMRELMKKRCARATTSPGWKLLKFYQQGEGMLSQMAYLHTLQASSLHVVTGKEEMWSALTFLLALAINLSDIAASGKSEKEGDRVYLAGTVLGAAHVVISCLRLVAFMYNRQQKWLYEQNLPDLAMLRRVLRLGPQRVGEDVSPRGQAARGDKQQISTSSAGVNTAATPLVLSPSPSQEVTD